MDGAARERLIEGAKAAARSTVRLETRAAELLRSALHAGDGARTGCPAAPRPATPLAEPAGAMLSPPPDVQGAGGGPGAATGAAMTLAGDRVERALALVERIERFVRSGRPSLALTLRGGFPGRLEVERVAPGTIALRLSSPRAPPAGELGRLRQALEARGLSVRSLESGGLIASAGDACSPCP